MLISPREWGWPGYAWNGNTASPDFPTRVGMARPHRFQSRHRQGFPHASGDGPLRLQRETDQHAKAGGKWDSVKTKKRPQSEIQTLQNWMCSQYFDIRNFGGVLSTGPNAGQIRGPVQISFSRSIDRIVTAEHTITRLTDVDKEEGEMGRKFTIPYGLYKAQGFVSPFLVDQTGFTDADLELLFTALENAFQFDQSAARPAGSMNPRALLVFKHDTSLGNAPSHKLFELVTVTKKPGIEVPRSFSDYELTIDEAAIPSGVTLIRRI